MAGLFRNIPSFLLRPFLPSNAADPMFNYTIPSLYFVSFPTSQLLFVVLVHAEATPVTYFKRKDFKVGYLISNFPEIVTFPS